jgi:predicted dehydrogenase
MAVKVGLIGSGGIATGQHIPGYKALGADVELVSVADVNGERASSVAREHGFARSYSDYTDMLRAENLDAVSICTPNKFHALAAIEALKAGVNVLCEKPPARSAAEAIQMAASAAESGKVLMYSFNNRFRPESLMAKRFVDHGDLGDIYAARVRWLRRRGIPGWGVFTNKELQGGGPLIDIGVHMLDLALHLMGYPEPELVVGSTYNRLGSKPGVPAGGKWDWDNFEVEDMALGFIKFRNGATVMLESSFMEHMEPMEENNVFLSGTEGGMSLYPFKMFKDMNETIVNITPAFVPKGNGHAACIANFIAAIKGEAQPAVSPSEGVKLQKILDAIYQSASTGQAVSL